MVHICISILTIIGSDNGLSPGPHQAILWTNVRILLTGPLGTNFNEILIGIHTFSSMKIHLKMSSGKWCPFCQCVNWTLEDKFNWKFNKNTTIFIWVNAFENNVQKMVAFWLGLIMLNNSMNTQQWILSLNYIYFPNTSYPPVIYDDFIPLAQIQTGTNKTSSQKRQAGCQNLWQLTTYNAQSSFTNSHPSSTHIINTRSISTYYRSDTKMMMLYFLRVQTFFWPSSIKINPQATGSFLWKCDFIF